jgi:peptidoglycan/xylan/chitin deacetylase (PgdA/CDA1 family)
VLTTKLKTLRFQLYQIFEEHVTNMLAPVLPLNFLEKRVRPQALVPYYHLVSDEKVEHVIQLYSYRNTNQFKADLDYFLKHYQPVELADLLAAVGTGRELKEKAFLISVDDGFREVHDVMAPLLKQKGVPAVFFITTAYLDNQTLGYRHKASILAERFDQRNHSRPTMNKIAGVLGCSVGSRPAVKKALLSRNIRDHETLDHIASVLEVNFESYLSDVQPYLTTAQVRALIRGGFYIGAHSVDHFPYGTLTPAEQFAQTDVSMALVKQRFGLDYSLFAFPFSDHGVRASFFEAFSGQIDLFFGTSAFCRDPIQNNVHRFWMENTDDGARLILERLYARHQVRELFGLNQKKR